MALLEDDGKPFLFLFLLIAKSPFDVSGNLMPNQGLVVKTEKLRNLQEHRYNIRCPQCTL